MTTLDNEDSDKVRALICAGLSKLMLSGMISDDRVSGRVPSVLSPNS